MAADFIVFHMAISNTLQKEQQQTVSERIAISQSVVSMCNNLLNLLEEKSVVEKVHKQ